MFETKGKMNEKFYKDNYYSMTKKWRIVLILVLSALIIAYSVYFFTLGNYYKSAYDGNYYVEYYIFGIIYLVLPAAVLILFFVVRPRRYVKIMINRQNESYGTTDLELAVSFDEDGVVQTNNVNENKSVLKYENLKRIIKNKNYYLLVTKANLFMPVFVDQLSDGDKAALIDFLKEKTSIKNLK